MVLVAVLLLAFALLLRGQAAGATNEQNDLLWFSHARHVEAGVNCTFCHPGVLYDSAIAGIPSMVKCNGCHVSVEVRTQRGRETIEALDELTRSNVPLRWVKVYDIPDHVFFYHYPHIAAGVNCEACHGQLGRMDIAREAYRINMGFCLHCHRDQPAEMQLRLTACNTCHK